MTRRLETRRACLTLFGATAAVAASAWAELSLRSVPDDTSPGERAFARELRRHLDAEGSMHPFGRAYIATLPATPSIGAMVRELFGKELPAVIDDELTERLRTRIESDFVMGALASVSGWLLSRTEAVLCALMVAVDTAGQRER